MQWRNIGGSEAAHAFDLLVCRLQTEHLKQSSSFAGRRAELLGHLDDLPVNLAQVRAVGAEINEARTAAFWDGVDVARMEDLRGRLRGVMKYCPGPGGGGGPLFPKVLDVKEDPALIERKEHVVRLEGLQLAAYRNRVEKVLRELFDRNDTLQRIKKGQPVTEADLEALTSLVLAQDPLLDLHDLVDYYPDCAGHLDQAIRGIIGLDAAAVSQRFTAFVQQHPALNSSQIRFLGLLQNHIARYGSIAVARLYEPPFTTIHTDSLDGLFPDEAEASAVIRIIESFQPPKEGSAVA
jgi:type I restriction enzyme R subunit